MLHSIKNLKKCEIVATEGEVGKIRDAYFDDAEWAVRHLVVDTGNWLKRHEVLLSPLMVSNADWEHGRISVRASRGTIENSPPTSTHLPISQRAEASMASHYGIPYYRSDAGGKQNFSDDQARTFEADVAAASPEDQHLRSCNEVAGYSIAARDDSLGHVVDFLFNDEDWSIQYLVVDPVDLWPGKHVVLPVDRIERIFWTEHNVVVDMTADEVKNSPEYDPDHLPPPRTAAMRGAVGARTAGRPGV